MNLKITEFTYSTKERILYENASLDVDFTNIILKGKNGCGKSTLLNLLYNEKLDCTIDQKKLKRSDITYITQEAKLFKELKVAEHIKLFNVDNEFLINKIKDLGIHQKKVAKLSGGQLQILNICLALNKKSKIIFIDEPYNNISKNNRQVIDELLRFDQRPKIIVSHKEIDFCDTSLTIVKRRINVEVLPINKNI